MTSLRTVILLLAASAQANKFGSYSQREDLTVEPTMLDIIWDHVPAIFKPRPPQKDDPNDLSPYVKDEFRLEFEDIVEDYGYRFKEYDVYTSDGYILSLFRVRQRDL